MRNSLKKKRLFAHLYSILVISCTFGVVQKKQSFYCSCVFFVNFARKVSLEIYDKSRPKWMNYYLSRISSKGGCTLKNCAERSEARTFLGYFVWKITILHQNFLFFPIAERDVNIFGVFHAPPWIRPCILPSLHANPLAQNTEQVKLDSDKWKLWKKLFE
jgi:hypothetical protein